MKRNLALGGGHAGEPRGRQAGTRIAVAEHLDVAAEWDRAEFPAGSGTVVPAEQFGSEADREDVDAHPVAPGDKVMAELVDKDEDGQNEQKRDDIGQPAVHKCNHRKPTGAWARAAALWPDRWAATSRAVLS